MPTSKLGTGRGHDDKCHVGDTPVLTGLLVVCKFYSEIFDVRQCSVKLASRFVRLSYPR